MELVLDDGGGGAAPVVTCGTGGVSIPLLVDRRFLVHLF